MTGRRRTDKRVTTHPPVQAPDRRTAQRISVQIMARFSATDSFQHVGDGLALDLSKSGCKLCSALVLPIGSFWDLYLTIPETSPSGSHLGGSGDLGRGKRVRNRISSRYGTRADPATPFHLEAHEPRSRLRGGPPLVYPH